MNQFVSNFSSPTDLSVSEQDWSRMKNVWLGLGFMSAHKDIRFELTGRCESKNVVYRSAVELKNAVGWPLVFTVDS